MKIVFLCLGLLCLSLLSVPGSAQEDAIPWEDFAVQVQEAIDAQKEGDVLYDLRGASVEGFPDRRSATAIKVPEGRQLVLQNGRLEQLLLGGGSFELRDITVELREKKGIHNAVGFKGSRYKPLDASLIIGEDCLIRASGEGQCALGGEDTTGEQDIRLYVCNQGVIEGEFAARALGLGGDVDGYRSLYVTFENEGCIRGPISFGGSAQGGDVHVSILNQGTIEAGSERGLSILAMSVRGKINVAVENQGLVRNAGGRALSLDFRAKNVNRSKVLVRNDGTMEGVEEAFSVMLFLEAPLSLAFTGTGEWKQPPDQALGSLYMMRPSNGKDGQPSEEAAVKKARAFTEAMDFEPFPAGSRVEVYPFPYSGDGNERKSIFTLVTEK